MDLLVCGPKVIHGVSSRCWWSNLQDRQEKLSRMNKFFEWGICNDLYWSVTCVTSWHRDMCDSGSTWHCDSRMWHVTCTDVMTDNYYYRDKWHVGHFAALNRLRIETDNGYCRDNCFVTEWRSRHFEIVTELTMYDGNVSSLTMIVCWYKRNAIMRMIYASDDVTHICVYTKSRWCKS